MARLSEEHFKNNPAIPNVPARRPSRLKEMFKPRFSLSPKASSTVLIKPPPSGRSPAVFGEMKPGFEKVGVLPSERSSIEALKTARENGAASGVELAEALRDVSIPSNMHPSFANFDGSYITVEERSKAEQTHLRKVSGNQDTKPEVTSTPKSSVQKDLATVVKQDIEGPIEVPVFTFPQTVGDQSAPPDAVDDTYVNYDSSSLRRSFASNIFDDNDSLSRGIREYVASKIAEAVVEQERRIHALVPATPSQMLITFKFDGAMNAGDLFQGIENHSPTFNLLEGPKYIGPMAISHPRLASNIQSLAIAMYVVIVSGAALLGPKTLGLALWRIAVMLVVYVATGRHLGWCEDAQKEVLLAPVAYIIGVIRGSGKDVASRLGEAVTRLLVDAAEISATTKNC